MASTFIIALSVFAIYLLAGKFPLLAGFLAVILVKFIPATIEVEKASVREMISGALIIQPIFFAAIIAAYFYYRPYHSYRPIDK